MQPSPWFRRMDVRWRAARAALAGAVLLALAGCATVPPAAPAETIRILAINDFHGNLEPPGGITAWSDAGQRHEGQLGGAARLAATIGALRQEEEHAITVAAGDLIGASPLASAQFLDEPAIMALNRLGLELAAVGNHEFDRGTAELRRMQEGGCAVLTTRQPCQLDAPFEGASFAFLAANVLDDEGATLFPGTAIRRMGGVQVGFIGLTLKETATLVSPAGTRGYRFADEAATANRAAERLLAEGADAIVLLIHQGGRVDPANNLDACPQLDGAIVPIVAALSPAIRVVVSGHTHMAYVCELPLPGGGGTRLLTSAGRYGHFVTAIDLAVDPQTDAIVAASARNHPVSEAAGEQADVAALVARYVAAARPLAARVVGTIAGTLDWAGGARESAMARLIADSQLAATRDTEDGGAQVAFINSGGVRNRLEPAGDGSVTYGQLFAVQPFGNTLVVLEMTGRQLKAVLEEQFGPDNLARPRQSLLIPSRGFTYTIDPARPAGERVVAMRLDGQPVAEAATYRVTVNNFLASGGDGFATFAQAPVVADGGPDLDAMEVYIAAGVTAPADRRVLEAGDDAR